MLSVIFSRRGTSISDDSSSSSFSCARSSCS
jgi:hypothetical protein